MASPIRKDYFAKIIPRDVVPKVEGALARQVAVALVCPRQVGKTTLALAIGEGREALYLDLEDRDDRTRLTNPALFLESVEDRLVVFDEIHRMTDTQKAALRRLRTPVPSGDRNDRIHASMRPRP